jgi:adenylylsulfate kinase
MSNNTTWHQHTITKEQRAQAKNQKPCILWFTGLSGSGKSTLANLLESKLYEMGYHTYLLDGDNVRHGLNNDLGFDDKSREENIRRVGEVAKLLVDSGLIVLATFISPFKSDRKKVRDLVSDSEFIEIFVDTPLEICEQRDPKKLYEKARNGEIKNFTGIDSPYEKPDNMELHIVEYKEDIKECLDKILHYLVKNGYINVR